MKKYLILTLAVLTNLIAQAQHIEVLQQGKPNSIRGLSVVDNQVAWISASNGTIANTTDGGKTWNWKQVTGFEKSDFRDIEAFSAKEAVIMSSGTPAVILKTVDGGESWKVKYQNADSAYFFDAMDFDGTKHGLVLGDPIKGKFLMMETKDGGETWQPYSDPPDAIPGEAAFAASGTCIRVSSSTISIISGGAQSRIIRSAWGSNFWTQIKLPFAKQKQSQGGFSAAIQKEKIIVVGGDYAKDRRTDSVSCILNEVKNKISISFPLKSPEGFQSCVEFITGSTFLSTGTPGSNLTTDGGSTFTKIDDASYNVCRKAKHGTLVLLAGDHGRIGIFKP